MSGSRTRRNYIQSLSKNPSKINLTQITICYNKIGDKEKFEKLLTYNVLSNLTQLILLHDSKAKRNINWNDINHVIKSNIRALHISKICLKSDLLTNLGDKKCFEKELR